MSHNQVTKRTTTVLPICVLILASTMAPELPEASDLARASLAELVEFHRATTTARDITLQHDFVDGSPRSTLLEAGRSADLIVVGSRGHGPIGAALLGSVSSWLVHNAERPVVVVPAQ